MRFDRSFHAAPRAAFALLLAAAAFLPGCSSNRLVQPVMTPISRVALALHADTLAVGGLRQFTATAYDTNSVATSNVQITWTSTDVAVCMIDETGLATAVGEGAALVIASAGGKSDTASVYVKSAQTGWYSQTSGTLSNLNGVCFLADGHTGFAVGATGTMVTTTDAGATWSPRASGAALALNSVWFSDATTGWAVGETGTLVKSTDGGATWARQVNLLTSANLKCVRFVDAQNGWIVGGSAAGFVARTSDGGLTWTSMALGGSVLYSVSFANALDGWAVGVAGVIYGTHDGGAGWYLVQPSLTSQTFRGVARVSNTLAWAVGGLGTIATTLATADSLDWQPPTTSANYQLNAVQMVSGSTGWIAGSNLGTGAILGTTDGGLNWTLQTTLSSGALNSVYFADGLRGWAVGAGGRIVHTSTAGAL